MIILILGPDGVGKTTVSQELANRLNFEYYYGGARNPATWILKLRQKRAKEKINKTGNIKNNDSFTKPTLLKRVKSKTMRYLSLFLLVFDGIVKLKQLKKQNRDFILDRSVFDVFIQNDEMWQMSPRNFLIKFFKRFIDRAILLEVEPKKVFERKQELTVEEISKQYERYRTIIELVDGKIVENYDFEKTVESIDEIISRDI